MAVTLREYPTVKGKDATRFLKRQEQQKLNLQKRADKKLASRKNA
ncbi:hypothetical protein [Desulfitobacterium dehalogenans]|nr:hypothetical protein [Desulfitobacterium dehalogenans]